MIQKDVNAEPVTTESKEVRKGHRVGVDSMTERAKTVEVFGPQVIRQQSGEYRPLMYTRQK